MFDPVQSILMQPLLCWEVCRKFYRFSLTSALTLTWQFSKRELPGPDIFTLAESLL